MSPEQARGESLDGRTDLYAAAIILWELLTGRQLFAATPSRMPGEEPQDDLLERVRHPQIVPPSQKASRVPRELDVILGKALAEKPEDRFQSGEEFRIELAAFLAKNAPSHGWAPGRPLSCAICLATSWPRSARSAKR
jgi:serine/threonine protein kinase